MAGDRALERVGARGEGDRPGDRRPGVGSQKQRRPLNLERVIDGAASTNVTVSGPGVALISLTSNLVGSYTPRRWITQAVAVLMAWLLVDPPLQPAREHHEDGESSQMAACHRREAIEGPRSRAGSSANRR